MGLHGTVSDTMTYLKKLKKSEYKAFNIRVPKRLHSFLNRYKRKGYSYNKIAVMALDVFEKYIKRKEANERNKRDRSN